jgi:hypothetical protein
MKAIFVKERETKGAVLYKEVNEENEQLSPHEALIGTFYVRKHNFDGNIPNKVEIELTW